LPLSRSEPVLVRTWDVAARGWPQSLAGLRIAHVSDFHFTRWTRPVRHAQQLLKMLDYDLLLVTGDFGLFHRWWPHAATMTRRFFAPLAGRVPMFAVLGNHDHPNLASVQGLPLAFLRNQVASVSWSGTKINVAGIEQSIPRAGDLKGTLAQAHPDAPTLLLAHYPSTVYQLSGQNVQLVLSGHTHGGQIRLPWLGCIWPNDRIPRKMASGLHLVNDVHIHISAGIGVSLPIRMRINCPPEIAILTMRAAREEK
jgi:predicted MPP superfamily phosphohydrolase